MTISAFFARFQQSTLRHAHGVCGLARHLLHRFFQRQELLFAHIFAQHTGKSPVNARDEACRPKRPSVQNVDLGRFMISITHSSVPKNSTMPSLVVLFQQQVHHGVNGVAAPDGADFNDGLARAVLIFLRLSTLVTIIPSGVQNSTKLSHTVSVYMMSCLIFSRVLGVAAGV